MYSVERITREQEANCQIRFKSKPTTIVQRIAENLSQDGGNIFAEKFAHCYVCSFPQVHTMLRKELESLKVKHKDMFAELKTYKDKVCSFRCTLTDCSLILRNFLKYFHGGFIVFRFNASKPREGIKRNHWMPSRKHCNHRSKTTRPSKAECSNLKTWRLKLSGKHIHIECQLQHSKIFRVCGFHFETCHSRFAV